LLVFLVAVFSVELMAAFRIDILCGSFNSCCLKFKGHRNRT